ncbi:MAG: biotin transporter BioY [Lachnospirales bacterium]
MNKKLSTKELCLTAIFTGLTSVCAQIAIPLPFTPAPISFGMVGVYIAAILLTPRCAVLSQICYLLLGAIGLPVFGGFKGGMGALFGPTGGYLLVYPIMVAIVSTTLNSYKALNAKYSRKTAFIKGSLGICIAHLVLYIGGTAWLSVTTEKSFVTSLTVGVYPFIPLDIIKIIFCIVVILPLRERLLKVGILERD